MYLKLANIAQNSDKLLKTRPKFRYLSHISSDAQKRKSRRSAAGWDMWFMDEGLCESNVVRLAGKLRPRLLELPRRDVG